jgi:lipid-binding SYLF domain-containing protein
MKHVSLGCVCLVAVAVMFAGGCETAPKTAEDKANLIDEAGVALSKLKASDPTLEPFLGKAYGYAVFPSVGKGGLIAGGAYGRGVVYEQGTFIGYADLSQATIGLQAGGQSFMEVVAFENLAALDRFRSGKFSFAANASAVALKAGAGEGAAYKDGAVVFVEPVAGLMLEAAVGGQKFTFVPAR